MCDPEGEKGKDLKSKRFKVRQGEITHTHVFGYFAVIRACEDVPLKETLNTEVEINEENTN